MSASSKPLSRLLYVQLLGALQVTLIRDPAPCVLHLSQGPVTNLLSYLALYASTAIPRSRLAGLLNPDVPEANARRALTDALYRLRRDLGETAEWIQSDAETIQLVEPPLWVDVHEFRRWVASTQPEDWRRALDLYGGDLLEDDGAEWVLAPRAALREQFLALHERLCAALIDASRLPDALAYAHRWTLADPLCEQAHRAAMQLYARLGRPAAALEQYDRLTRSLADELNVEPLAETRALAEAIRKEYRAAPEKIETKRLFVGRRCEPNFDAPLSARYSAVAPLLKHWPLAVPTTGPEQSGGTG